MKRSDLMIRRRRMADLSGDEVNAWRHLVDEGIHNRLAFLTPTYCQAVDRALGKVWVVLAYRGNTLEGVMPLQSKEGYLGKLGVFEPVGGSMADYFGFVAISGFKLDIAQVMARARVGCVDFSHLDESIQCAYGLVGTNPRIGLRTRIQGIGSEHWEALRKSDKKLVQDTERRERNLVARHGAMQFELRSSQPGNDLKRLIQLKTAQYERTSRSSAPLFDLRYVRLLEALLALGDPQCTAYLSVLRVSGRPVAFHLGLRCYDVLHIWFPAYDPDFASFSPGRILLRYLIQDGSQLGIRVLDRGEGDTQAKRDFANEEHRYVMGVWHAGLVGMIGRLALSVHWHFAAAR